MINLRLAEYNLETGKFERFLELGKDFLFGGDYIMFARESGYFYIDSAGQEYREQFRDEKDPLNRFGGLFDGRTYGNGRFVLILQSMHGQEGDGKVKELDEVWHHPDQPDDPNYHNIIKMWNLEERNFFCSVKKGNLHENPELYDRIGRY
jgi:hypothetical protein